MPFTSRMATEQGSKPEAIDQCLSGLVEQPDTLASAVDQGSPVMHASLVYLSHVQRTPRAR